MKIIILGPQASGKGTQADMLCNEFGVTHINMGERLRNEVAKNSAIGKQIAPILERGELVPAELTHKILSRYLRESKGFVLDGFPRTLEQAKFLDTVSEIDRVIHLKIKDKTAVERIAGRRVCAKGHDYHMKSKPPKKEGVCDLDGLPLHTREDDTESVIKTRLKLFHEQTEPLLSHYKGKVADINAEQSITQVHLAILKNLRL